MLAVRKDEVEGVDFVGSGLYYTSSFTVGPSFDSVVCTFPCYRVCNSRE